MPDAAPQPQTSRAVYALLTGAALGLALAAWGLLANPRARDALPPAAVASVNGVAIFEDGYRRLLAGFEADTRNALSPAQQKHVLDRMIDEELLVQRGLELGLAESDRRVRADISSAVIRAVVVEAEDEPPQPREVAKFYEREQAFFRQPGRTRVARIFIRAPNTTRAPREENAARKSQAARTSRDAVASRDENTPRASDAAHARALRARARLLAGEPLARVRAALGDAEVLTLPDALLPPAKLREYVGPTLAAAVQELEAGAVSEPLRDGAGYHVFVMRAKEPARTPSLDEIRDSVRAEFVRRAGDRALREYLDELRRAADVRVRATLFTDANTPAP